MARPVRRILATAAAALIAAGAVGGALVVRSTRGLTAAWRWDPDTAAEDRRLVEAAVARIPPRQGTGPDVVLVVLDTVRRDRLETYGNPVPTMPRLAAWARGARVWTRATAESPWTLPSHASLFTGLPSALHGAEGSALEGRVPEGGSREARRRRMRRLGLERPLPDAARTVAEHLAATDRITLGIAGNRAYLQGYWGLSQGFDAWLCDGFGRAPDGLPYVRGDRITAAALTAVDALRARAAPRPPLFLFVNYTDAHVPYVPRRGFVRNPGRLTRRWRTGDAREELVARVLAREERLPAAARAGWLEAYDAELRFLDAQVGDLLDGLATRGIGDGAWILVTSDHGEYFGEHDLVEHSKDVYEEALAIPLLARGPGIAPGSDPTPVQLGDVGRWIVEWAGAEPLPQAPDDGGLVVSELYGSRIRDLSHPAYGARFDRVRRAFRREDHVVILGSDGSSEAYDLAADPGETADRSAEPWAADLRAEAEAWIARNAPVEGPPAAAPMPEETRRALEALGYAD